MAEIKVTATRPIRVDQGHAARTAGEAIVAAVKKRVAKERDVADARVVGYSDLYRQQLAALGKTANAGAHLAELIKGLRVARISVTNGRARVEFAVDGTVQSTARPPPWVFDRNKTPEQRAAALARWRAAPKKTHTHAASLVLRMLAVTTPDRRARRLLGVSPSDRALVIKALEREGGRIFRTG
jgi:hypothetical protein